jgi:hypothetical protein
MAKSKDSKSAPSTDVARLHALPFVDMSLQTNPEDFDDRDRKLWTLPAEGLSYVDGCDAGKWAARAFVKYLRERESHESSTLQLVAFGLARRLQVSSNSEREALHGHLVGFFDEIERTMIAGIGWGAGYTDAEIARNLAAAARGEPLKRFEAECAAFRARARATRKATKPTGRRSPRAAASTTRS